MELNQVLVTIDGLLWCSLLSTQFSHAYLVYLIRSGAFFLSWIVISTSLVTTLIAVLKPFKSPHNVVTAVFLHVLTLTSAGGISLMSSVPTASYFSVYVLALGAFVAAFPLFYAIVILCYWCYMHRHRQRAAWRTGYEELSTEPTVIDYANH